MTRAFTSVLTALIALSTLTTASAADIYVDTGSAAATESGTKAAPYKTVQAAIDAAKNKDTLRVAAGTYTENLRVDTKDLVLEGGYSAADWSRDIAKNTTTLQGAGGEAVVTLLNADATVEGFRITGGEGSTVELPYGYHGGGIYSRDGSPTISNNTIEDNDIRKAGMASDYHFGGGIRITGAPNAMILNNTIRKNFAGRGGGIAIDADTALIQGNTIEENVGIGDHGGGMFIAVKNAKVTGNIIRGNEIGRALTYGWGGGLIVVNKGNAAELSFNVLYENFAAAYGAAEFIDEGAEANIHHELIYDNVSKIGCEAVSAISVDGGDDGGSTATISHCTVVGNICENSTRGNGLQVEGMSTVTVKNSIFWDNGGDDFATDGVSTLTVTYTDSEEKISGAGNINEDPMFVDEAANDYHLAVGSPCIDAGDPASPFDGEPAPNGNRADMGRYGNADDDSAGSNGNNNNNSNSNDNANGNDGGSNVVDGTAALCGASSPAMMSLCLGLWLIGFKSLRVRRKK